MHLFIDYLKEGKKCRFLSPTRLLRTTLFLPSLRELWHHHGTVLGQLGAPTLSWARRDKKNNPRPQIRERRPIRLLMHGVVKWTEVRRKGTEKGLSGCDWGPKNLSFCRPSSRMDKWTYRPIGSLQSQNSSYHQWRQWSEHPSLL